ncbi:MAG TPA: YciI family protein [Chloroflexota bacterium]|nr:YciI family protein [Chloroflexota bacterium]
MPRYLALIYGREADMPALNSPERQQVSAAYGSFTEDVQKGGVLRGGDALLPTSMATTVRVRDGKTLTTDGPFAETKEQLGGFYAFECKDLDEAIAWAAKIPGAAVGSIEVRPILEM